MAKKEPPEELQRQKEDIENLLSSLETAFTEGTITQEHYNEVKQKNAAKLEEITKKLGQAQKQVEKQEAPKEEPAKKPKKQEPPPEEAQPEEKDSRKQVPETPAPRVIDEKENIERTKEKVLFELAPKLEKMSIKIEKLKAFVDALKDEKGGDREAIQRITEELGEMRSTTGSMEGRMSEMEMKLEDAAETLADLKPQKFTKELQRKEEEIKMHDARLEKLDDMNSTILKRVNQIQIILEKLGNIESIAELTKNISKKLMSIEDKDKKVTRLADKIDSMFVEINKRLEEFMFYKAKQDSLDDLSKEMLKSIDELTTKLTRYAEKDDLELLRDTLDNKIHTLMKESEAAAPAAQIQQERSEVDSLMKLLDEQFKKGQLSKKDYEKAKQANLQKIKEMDEGPRQPAEPVPMDLKLREEAEPLAEEAASTPTIPEKKEPAPKKEAPKAEEPKPPEESGLAQAAKIAQPPPAAEIQKEKPAKEGGQQKTKAPSSAPIQEVKKKTQEKEPPAEPEPAQKIPETEKLAKPVGKKEKMLSDLESSYRKGLISQRAYETTQRLIMAKKF